MVLPAATGTADMFSLPIADPTRAGEARRMATALADRLGFDDTGRGAVAIIASELANNLARHATGGELIVRALAHAGRASAGIELLSIDRGPGIANTAQAMRDGYSTGGTAGTGLGAVRRMAHEFDLHSLPGVGTTLVARLFASGAPPAMPIDVGVVSVPVHTEEVCGDGWAIDTQTPGRVLVGVFDGLGHGHSAAAAARLAERLFRENARLAPAQVVAALHAGLRSTRGAAVAVAELSRARGEARFCGVGNAVASLLIGAASRTMVSQNGTAGAEARRIQEFSYPWPADALLVMHTDGLSAQWQLPKYSGLRFRHPALVAAVLYRDFRRVRDDATVLVVRDAVSSLAAAPPPPPGSIA